MILKFLLNYGVLENILFLTATNRTEIKANSLLTTRMVQSKEII